VQGLPSRTFPPWPHPFLFLFLPVNHMFRVPPRTEEPPFTDHPKTLGPHQSAFPITNIVFSSPSLPTNPPPILRRFPPTGLDYAFFATCFFTPTMQLQIHKVCLSTLAEMCHLLYQVVYLPRGSRPVLVLPQSTTKVVVLLGPAFLPRTSVFTVSLNGLPVIDT